jgi:hypothetical protein
MYKIQYLDTHRWVDCITGYDEQMSISKAMCWSDSNPDRKVRVIHESNEGKFVVFFA